MDDAGFDALTRRLGAGLDRRSALRTGIAGIGASLAGVPPLRGAAGQASPVPAGPTGGSGTTEYLFVQVAASGRWEPKPGEPGVYMLTLEGATAQTIYFSDRPARLAGTAPTSTILAELGFTPADPPNAAIVARTAGGEDVLVVELFNPSHDEPSGSLAYEARMVSRYAGDQLSHLASRQGDNALPATFGEVSVFIDDANCPLPTEVTCERDGQVVYEFADLPSCFDYLGASGGQSDYACLPCEGAPNGDGRGLEQYWTDKCNADIAACDGECTVDVVST